MSCKLTLFALKLDELLHSSSENYAKVMVRHMDEPIGVRRDRIMCGRQESLPIGCRCDVFFLLSVRGSSCKVSRLRQSNMLNLMFEIQYQIGEDIVQGIEWTN